jgi:hypothetical protein
MKKAERKAHFGHENAAQESLKTFLLRELAKVFIERRRSFQTLCLFHFVRKTPPPAASSRASATADSKLNFGYSVVKHLSKK